jgi:hypothetical protein
MVSQGMFHVAGMRFGYSAFLKIWWIARFFNSDDYGAGFFQNAFSIFLARFFGQLKANRGLSSLFADVWLQVRSDFVFLTVCRNYHVSFDVLDYCDVFELSRALKIVQKF